jgi:hypothetical protein
MEETKMKITEKLRFSVAKKYCISQDYSRPQLMGTWEEKGYQSMCNGQIGFMLKDKIEGLPICTDPTRKFTLDSIIDIAEVNKINVSLDITEIKKQLDMATEVAKKRKCNINATVEGIYNIGNKQINIQYIYVALVMLGEDLEIYSDKNSPFSPLFFVSKQGKGIVAPLRN